MNCPKYDFHIHTKYLGCANATMEIPAIVKECERLGVVSLGITDHLDSFEQKTKHKSPGLFWRGIRFHQSQSGFCLQP